LKNKPKIDILGGGPAGLSVAYFARKKGHDICIYEGSSTIGGNCRTIKMGEYRFDTGAHRFHDKIPSITEEIKKLMGDDLKKVNAPSKIYFNGRMIDFPLSFSSVMKNLKISEILKIVAENIFNIFKTNIEHKNFEELAHAKYGPTLSNLFLINYTEKLWGARANELQTTISGNRLKNLNMLSMIIEMIIKNRKVKHLEGSFYYPKYGYGSIFDSIAKQIDYENISLNSKVKKIYHEDKKIKEIEFESGKIMEVKYIVNTLPINSIIQMLDPLPNENLIENAGNLKFRNLKICLLELDFPKLSNYASIYFPDEYLSITRIYEPKNRSLQMAPKDKTSLAIEIPYSQGDRISILTDNEVIDMVKRTLIKEKLFKDSDVLDNRLIDIKNAYPILKVNDKGNIGELVSFLQSFSNQKLIGRNVEFDYLHTHKIMDKAKLLVNTFDF
jgi:protoporphyrinogen oxidase